MALVCVMERSQTYGGIARLISSRMCGQMRREPSIAEITAIWRCTESRCASALPRSEMTEA